MKEITISWYYDSSPYEQTNENDVKFCDPGVQYIFWKNDNNLYIRGYTTVCYLTKNSNQRCDGYHNDFFSCDGEPITFVGSIEGDFKSWEDVEAIFPIKINGADFEVSKYEFSEALNSKN